MTKLFTNIYTCIFLIFYSQVVAAISDTDGFSLENYKSIWEHDIQVHGFLSQGLFHSSGNNFYGQSKNNLSINLTEIGLNLHYQHSPDLSFATQGIYRRAGESTGNTGDFLLDYALISYDFLQYQNMSMGIRAGRIKVPWGIYNETRAMSFTHPTIFLPFAYFERSRSLLLSMNGGQFYASQISKWGDLSFKFNYGFNDNDTKELLLAITNNPSVPGNLESKPNFILQLNYELMNGEYIFSVSYANLYFDYIAQGISDPYSGLKININPLILSFQYNAETFSFTSEYNLQWNEFTDAVAAMPDINSIGKAWYVQLNYYLLNNLTMTLRYDKTISNLDDPNGEQLTLATGGLLPAHIMFDQDIIVGLNWQINPSWMLRTEYHRRHGTSRVSALDNSDISKLAVNSNIYAAQISFRF